MIDKLIPGGRRYTDDKFQKARKELERLRLGNKIFEIDEDVQDETNLIVYEKKIVSNRIQISKNNCSLCKTFWIESSVFWEKEIKRKPKLWSWANSA